MRAPAGTLSGRWSISMGDTEFRWKTGEFRWETGETEIFMGDTEVGVRRLGLACGFGVRVVTVTPTEEKQADRAVDNGS